MEPIIFIYPFTIEGYDVTITIEFFPHIIVLEDSSPEPWKMSLKMWILSLICETANS